MWLCDFRSQPFNLQLQFPDTCKSSQDTNIIQSKYRTPSVCTLAQGDLYVSEVPVECSTLLRLLVHLLQTGSMPFCIYWLYLSTSYHLISKKLKCPFIASFTNFSVNYTDWYFFFQMLIESLAEIQIKHRKISWDRDDQSSFGVWVSKSPSVISVYFLFCQGGI